MDHRPLTITTLGNTSVRCDGQMCHFATRKTLALVIYLAVTHTAHTRPHLMELLWPASDEAHARTGLRRALAFARQALGSDVWTTDRERVELHLTPHDQIDIQTLDRAALLTHLPWHDDHLIPLTAALAHVHGAFGADLATIDTPELLNWLHHQQALRLQQLDQISASLSHHFLDTGQGMLAVHVAQQWVALHPTQEHAHQTLIEAYLAVGDAPQALTAYTASQDIMITELDQPLSLALASLLPRIQAHAAPLAVRSPATDRLRLPLVGRATGFASARQLYRQAAEGHPRVLIISGEMGIGKTRLMREVQQWVATQGADVVAGRALEMDGHVPYQPMVEAMRLRLAHENAPDDLLGDIWLAQLARIIPDLFDRYPDLPHLPDDATGTSHSLFEAIAQCTLALARRAPLVLIMDDIQWADAGTRDLFQFLLQRWRDEGARVLLVLAVQTEAEATTPALHRWLMQGMGYDAQHLVLEPLSADATHELISTLFLRQDDADRVAAWLYDATAGHPLFIMQILRDLVNRQVLAWDGTDQLRLQNWPTDALVGPYPFPETLRAVMLARLERLSAAARSIMEVIATSDAPCTAAFLGSVAQLEADAVMQALEEALVYRVIQPAAEGYAFVHAQMGEFAYATLSSARRQFWHMRIYHALAASHAPDAVLAHHAWQAGAWPEAFRAYCAIGAAALRRSALADALHWYEHADHCLQAHPTSATPAEQLQLALHLSRAYQLAEQDEQAEAIARAALLRARQANDGTSVCVLLNHLATLAMLHTFDLPAIQAFVQEALRVAQHDGDVVGQIQSAANLAEIQARLRWEPNSARPYAERAVQVARQQGSATLLAFSLQCLLHVLTANGAWEEGIAVAEEIAVVLQAPDAQDRSPMRHDVPILMPPAVEHGPHALHADQQMHHALALIFTGAVPAGLHLAREAYAEAQRLQSQWLVAMGSFSLTLGLLSAGFYEDALTLAHQTGEQAADPPQQRFWSLYILALAQQHVLQNAAALATYDRLAHLTQDVGTAAYHEIVAAGRCMNLAALGQWEAAAEAAHVALARRAEAHILRTYTDLTRCWEVEALLRVGAIAMAQQAAASLDARAGANRRYHITQLRCRAMIAQYTGDAVGAEAALRTAEALARELALPGDEWTIAVKLAHLAAITGDATQSLLAQTRARGHMALLAERIHDPALRAGFVEQANDRLQIIVQPHDQRVLPCV